jgi:ParB-like chromosome segregation protein Spo0J
MAARTKAPPAPAKPPEPREGKIAESLMPLSVPIESLAELAGNPRRGDVAAVARSLDEFSQRKPIIATKDGTVIAGNHTLAAARSLGWTTIAVVWVDDDESRAKAFSLADNRTHDLGGYDQEALASLVTEVATYDAALVSAAGFDDKSLAKMALLLDPPLPEFAPVPEAQRLDEKGTAVHCPSCGHIFAV